MTKNTFLASLIRVLENKELTGLERYELVMAIIHFNLEGVME